MPHPLHVALLTLALLFAQLEIAVHHLDLAKHTANGACEFCLTHADLTDSATSASLPPPVAPAGSNQPVSLPVAYPTPHHEHYSARAPPPPAS